MVFGKNLRKMLSSTRDQDSEDTSDPPPPYTLPEEFIQAGIVEDDLAILRDYDTRCDPPSRLPFSTEPTVDFCCCFPL